MKSLVFQDYSSTVRVEFLVEMISTTAQNFTVLGPPRVNNSPALDISNGVLPDNPTAAQLWVAKNMSSLKQLPYSIASFTKFAYDNNMKLTLLDTSSETGQGTVLQDFWEGPYYDGALGLNNLSPQDILTEVSLPEAH